MRTTQYPARRVFVSLDGPTFEAVKELAHEEDRSPQEQMRHIIREAVREQAQAIHAADLAVSVGVVDTSG